LARLLWSPYADGKARASFAVNPRKKAKKSRLRTKLTGFSPPSILGEGKSSCFIVVTLQKHYWSFLELARS
jgi:hypothetical protein